MPSSAPSSSSFGKTFLRIVVVLAILGGAGWGGKLIWKQVSPGLFGTKRTDKIPTARVKVANISEEIVAVGRVRAVFSTELRAEVNGRIVKLLVADGQPVTKDQEILRLDQTDLLTQLQEIDRNIEASRLRAERARHDFERQKDLGSRGLIAAKDLDDVRITYSLAENDSAIAEARAANLRDKLSKTTIRAPHTGTLLLRDLTEGQLITSAAAQNGGTLLGEVADLSALMVRTNINEIDVARISLGEGARVRIDPLRNAILAGSVHRIATSATENQNDRTRVFPVDVYLEGNEPRLRPGMSATMTFTLAQAENTPSLSLSAVFSTAEAVHYVFIRKGETFEARAVEIGIADTRRVQVLSGLIVNDEVALSRPLEFEGEIPAPPAPVIKPKLPRRSGS
jgi:RND family efflux transporter MFP subunit